MKRFISLLLTLALIFPFFVSLPRSVAAEFDPRVPSFSGMSDPALRRYLEDAIYDELIRLYAESGQDVFVSDVQAVYVSQEYLDELEYNSKENIYFGYTLAELDEQFGDTKYCFTIGDDGNTIAVPFETVEDPMEKIMTDTAIGTGVILLCVTLAIVGGPAVSTICAVAAKTASLTALSSAGIGAVIGGVTNYIATGDQEKAFEAAALSASEGFKWGAISGALSGGFTRFKALKDATAGGLKINEVAQIQKESSYPLDIIKRIKNMEQYQQFKNMGCVPK